MITLYDVTALGFNINAGCTGRTDFKRPDSNLLISLYHADGSVQLFTEGTKYVQRPQPVGNPIKEVINLNTLMQILDMP